MDWATLITGAGYTSDVKVAEAMEGTAVWPKNHAPKVIRSLGARVSELKRGEYGWWCGAKGRRFRPALAEVLHVPIAELDLALDAANEGGGDVLPFDVFPELRSFDAAKEGLPPGIPNELTTVARIIPTPTWWITAPGAGRRMVGAWLRVRQHWRVVDADDWSGVEELLVEDARLFVRLKTPSGVPELPELPLGASLIVAASFPPPAGDADYASNGFQTGWLLVRTAPAADWAEALVDWVDERLDDQGGFSREPALELVEQYADTGVLSTPGDLLDLLAVLDHVGDLDHTDPSTLFNAYVRLACQRAGLDASDSRRLREHAWTLLTDMTRRRVEEGARSSLPDNAWASLVRVSAVGREALSALAADNRLSKQELRAKVKELGTPNGDETIELLRRARLLRPFGDAGELQLTPPWLSTIVLNSTAVALAHEGVATFGLLVVHPETAGLALDLLLSEVKQDNVERTRNLLGAIDSSPEIVAARSLAVRAVGLSLVAGVDVPSELLDAAWAARQRAEFARFHNFPPVPRVPPAHEEGDEGLVGNAAYLLAALALAERIPAAADTDDPFLTAWQQPNAASGWLFHLDGIDGDELVEKGLYRLGGRLVDRAGPAQADIGMPRFLRPHVLVRMSQGDAFDLKPRAASDVMRLRFPPSALDLACIATGTTRDDVLRWCWSRWNASTDRDAVPPVSWAVGRGFDRDLGDWPDHAHELWKVLPVEAMDDRVMEFLAHEASQDVWPVLSSDHRESWASWWRTQPTAELASVGHIPVDLFFELLRDGLGVDAFFPHAMLWEGHSDEMLSLLSDLVGKPPVSIGPGRELATEILFAAPLDMSETMLGLIEAALDDAGTTPAALQHLPMWLHQRIERRAPGWRHAYQLLDRLSPPGGTTNTR